MSEYGMVADDVDQSGPACAGLRPAPPARVPTAVMPTSIQNATDQRARVFHWVSKVKFDRRAGDKNMKLAVLTLAIVQARPLRKRTGSNPGSLLGKYRIKISLEMVRVLDYMFSAYTPDRNGKLKYESFFDAGGRFRFNSAKVAKQLDIPRRTLQRILAQLHAMRLLDCKQSSTQNLQGEYRGSTMWVTPRGDIYMQYLKEVIIEKSIKKAGGHEDEKPVADVGAAAIGQEFPGQGPAQETPVLEASRNDNIVIPYNVLMETPTPLPKATIPLASPKKINNSWAGAPLALPPKFSNCVSEGEKPVSVPDGQGAGSVSSAPPSPGVTTDPGKMNPPETSSDDPVALIEAPASALAIGDASFQQVTRRVATAFPEAKLKPSHCHQLRAWMSRSSPLERLTYDDLDEILQEHESGCQRRSLDGKTYRLTLEWLIKAWPQILCELRHEQLESRHADSAEHCLKMMTTQAVPEFEARVRCEVQAIKLLLARDGSAASYDPCVGRSRHQCHRAVENRPAVSDSKPATLR